MMRQVENIGVNIWVLIVFNQTLIIVGGYEIISIIYQIFYAEFQQIWRSCWNNQVHD